MKVKKYDKLIRDNIPEIIKNSGKKVITKRLSDEEYIEALNSKLVEELQEYLESSSVEELADLVEVVYGILDCKGVSIDEFENVRKNKNRERGAFRERLLLVEVIED